MADPPTSTASPPLQPPILEVGYNYTWPFNRYGTVIGPIDTQNNPPRGVDSEPAKWLDPRTQAPAGTLANNLRILRDELKITKVRIFLLCNCDNYGTQPNTVVKVPGPPVSDARSFFTAPAAAHPLFAKHFEEMVQVFKNEGMQMIPVLIDFGAFYPRLTKEQGGPSGGGRTDIVIQEKERDKFLLGMVAPLLQAANKVRDANKTIFAFEVVNEPFWNVNSVPRPLGFFGRPHTTTTDRDFAPVAMTAFIDRCLRLFENAGFQTTVGHRFFSDLTGLLASLPVGSMPQFHYYGGRGLDPDRIPDFSSLAGNPRTKNAFVGEFGAAVAGKTQLGKPEPGAQWDDCGKRDSSVRTAAFERLAVLARKGYKLAFVWPDLPDTGQVAARDLLKLSDDAKESIKQFTRGRFPNGVPREP